MSTAQRQPLGVSGAINVKSKSTHAPTNDGEKQKRSADGVVKAGSSQIWTVELEASKMELENARARIHRREETIKSLENKHEETTARRNAELQKKLQQLVESHHSSKHKYQAQLSNLQSENTALQHTISEKDKEVEHLRDKQTSVNKEKEDLQKTVNTLQTGQAHDIRKEIREYENEKTEWKMEKHRLERNVASLTTELEHLKASLNRTEKIAQREDDLRKANRALEKEISALRETAQEVDKLEEENERLVNLLVSCSIQYRMLYKNSVPRVTYQQLEEKLAHSRMSVISERNRAKVLRSTLEARESENRELKERLETYKCEIETLSDTMTSLLEDRQHLREEVTSITALHPASDIIKPLKPLPLVEGLKLVLNHAELSESHYQAQLTDLREEHFDLINETERTKASYVSTAQKLDDLRQSFGELKTAHRALEVAYAPCQPMIDNLQNLLAASEAQVAQLSTDLAGTSDGLRRCTKQSKEDREALKKANEVVMRSKMAEEALDEEVKHLQEAYTSAAGYEELYMDLQERYELLEHREKAAVDEAEKLGLENAELAGHQNEYQKINYVEGVRREMVLLKQELAATRHLLNLANDRVLNLQDEVQAYTSIDPSANALRSSMNGLTSSRLRVSRRQPENGRLTVHRSKGRSVSGPVVR
uniref:Hyaluronan-mediated motility receptor C-terminal domain-containing protein n=1 Tax=Kwoniella dejecticola CBS 10117 TaxID=1296121 RepID=A0A1A5ZZP6_9TREE|nr:uncharacterized protein I303_06853 [Kwoniella dejecticola CBS 10117]OBR83290.1 hypothetical protein I303_06853 [Kwoniella dejecticola CBS 10117]